MAISKLMGTLFFLSLLFFNSGKVMGDESWYGFCHAQKGQEILCSGIRQKDSGFENYCKAFAQSISVYSWKMQYSTSVKYLQDKQNQICDRIISGSDAKEYHCYVTTYCPNGGQPTSSIAPIGHLVLALSSQDALKQCLIEAEDLYYNFFSTNSKNGCSTTASAQ